MNVSQINTAIIQGSFTNDELTSMSDAIRFARSKLVNKVKFTISNGSRVKFTSNRTGMVMSGTVEKMAIKFATVNTGQGRWKVPMNMLESA
jgi:hypothetical protein